LVRRERGRLPSSLWLLRRNMDCCSFPFLAVIAMSCEFIEISQINIITNTCELAAISHIAATTT